MLRFKSAYWHSPAGRSVAFGCIASISLASIAIKVLPHTFFQDKHADFVHLYRGLERAPVREKVIKLFEESLNTLKIDNKMRQLIQPFMISIFEFYSIGNAYLRHGAKIGIPAFLEYETDSDIDKINIKAGLNNIDWGCDDGFQFADSLLFPDKVKIFGLCREILWAQTYRHQFECALIVLPFCLTYSTSVNLNNKLKLFQKPIYVRFSFYALIALFNLGLYFVIKDTMYHRYEKKVDEQLGKLGQDFIEAGVVFYDKILQRNQALRIFLGKDGEKHFTKKGNETFLFRQKRTPITKRKEYFESLLPYKEQITDKHNSHEE